MHSYSVSLYTYWSKFTKFTTETNLNLIISLVNQSPSDVLPMQMNKFLCGGCVTASASLIKTFGCFSRSHLLARSVCNYVHPLISRIFESLRGDMP